MFGNNTRFWGWTLEKVGFGDGGTSLRNNAIESTFGSHFFPGEPNSVSWKPVVSSGDLQPAPGCWQPYSWDIVKTLGEMTALLISNTVLNMWPRHLLSHLNAINKLSPSILDHWNTWGELKTKTKKTQAVPWQVNFLDGVVRSSLSAISPGPAHRAIPGSLYSDFTQSDNHCMLQSQCSGFAPMALQTIKKRKKNQ